ncbi:hypothetical protein LQ954_08125 [Sphingomonas sp. IC-11]|uniref:hypothetical protein n=1 Tax=Sphingomonas sp. IC-11 TaxID=2898528 RepID=UPI001E530EC3|nr:hypothetical protein [Sphingomonas sp. IC-11]MCD2316114.1 hypothetical protein [Sphingomonas sp. IC-11]
MTNATHTNAGQKGSATLAERARDAAGGAQARVTSATTATMDAAKGHPYAAAGIIAGVAAAVGGAAYAATRRGQPGTGKGKTKH